MAESKTRLRALAAELRDADDEITENHIHLHPPPGTTIEADATGRLKAISVPDTERETPTVPPAPEKVSVLIIGWTAVRKMPPWGVVLVALACLAAYVALHR